MSDIETGGPAFPVKAVPENYFGMTLRDYFAAKAMQGYLASCATDFEPAEFASTIAKDAYVLADSMLKARQS